MDSKKNIRLKKKCLFKSIYCEVTQTFMKVPVLKFINYYFRILNIYLKFTILNIPFPHHLTRAPERV